MSKFILSFFIAISSIGFAHEGHDHGPGSIEAPKGGVIRNLETVVLELLAKGSEIKIYTYDKELKPQKVSQFPASATITKPKKKPEAVTLQDQGEYWLVKYDAKGEHRYTLTLDIKQGGHQDKMKWVIEPKP